MKAKQWVASAGYAFTIAGALIVGAGVDVTVKIHPLLALVTAVGGGYAVFSVARWMIDVSEEL